jgi:signal peptidase I
VRIGILWLLAFWFSVFLVRWAISTPLISGLWLGWIMIMACIILYVRMLYGAFRPIPKVEFKRWIMFLVVYLTASVLLEKSSSIAFRAYSMTTNSMDPTIRGPAEGQEHDHMVAQRFAYLFSKPKRGDIVVFKTTTTRGDRVNVKRIIGLPGETISLKDRKVWIDGRQINEPSIFNKMEYVPINEMRIVAHGAHLSSSRDSFRIPDGEYFVLGDNTYYCRDSRFYGPVPEKNILGKVTKIILPLERVRVPE